MFFDMKPWSEICIKESGEPFAEIPSCLLRLLPHPYVSKGAPYENGADPFWLRDGVLKRLLIAQKSLAENCPECQLAIFDAWRPIAVQQFMYDLAIHQECQIRGCPSIELLGDHDQKKVLEAVQNFWALPTTDPLTPPPHSTGAAIDITLADLQGIPIDMGGEIDAISNVSRPDYYIQKLHNEKIPNANLFQERRSNLANVMKNAGFSQHPNEWWHFSYGDQMWAWFNKCSIAIYGSSSPFSSSSIIV